MIAQVLISAISLALLAADAPGEMLSSPDAEYVRAQEFISPISGEPFVAYLLKDNVKVASYDYDRCPHPPLNVLAYTLVIDPVSGYVDYPESFGRDFIWDAVSLQRVLGEPKFNRSTPAGLPWSGAYPWEKFENAAALAEDQDADALTLANWWVLAAWSVRLDVISGHNEFDREVEKLFAKLPKRKPDPKDLVTLYELQLAEYWDGLRKSSQLPEVDDVEFSLAMAWLYRSRGELQQAQQWLERASLDNPNIGSESTLHHYLSSSIELEESYLGKARSWLVKGWNDGALLPQVEGGTAFMIGEIDRRLGNMDSAAHWYNLAKDKNYGMLSTDLIEHQLRLVEKSQGFRELK